VQHREHVLLNAVDPSVVAHPSALPDVRCQLAGGFRDVIATTWRGAALSAPIHLKRAVL
jgi:hypothetical protein